MTEITEPTPARRSTYLRSGVIALAVVVVIGVLINLLLLERHTGSTVDGQEIAQDISQAIQAKTGAARPPQVACPGSLPSAQTTFDCTLQEASGLVIVEVHRSGSTFTWTQTNRPAEAPRS
jgi:hypothetical protein